MSPVVPRTTPFGSGTPRGGAFTGHRSLGRAGLAPSWRSNVGAAVPSVTGASATNTFTKTAHPFQNNDNVVLSNLVGSASLAKLIGGGLFIINRATNTFQLAGVPNGTPVVLDSDVTSVTVQKVSSSVPTRVR